MEIKLCDEFFYRITNNKKDINKLLNTSHENILRNNPDLKFYDGEWVKIKLNDYMCHHVKPAETLKDIAEKYKITTTKLILDNNLQNDKLFIGQILKIKH